MMPAVSHVGVVPGGGDVGHQAGEAGGFAGQDRHRLAFGADAAAVDPRLAVLHREIVEQEPRGEVVGAIDDHVDVARQFADVVMRHVGNDRLDFALRN